MKTNAIIRICIYSVLILLLLGILAAVLSFTGSYNRWNDDVTYLSDSDMAEFAAGDVRNIQIEWAAGDITVQPGDTDVILVSESRKDKTPPMVCSLNNGSLDVAFSETKFTLGFGFGRRNMGSKDLTITVPRDFDLRVLEMDIASSKVTISDMTIDKLDFDGADVRCDIQNCTVGSLDMDGASCKAFFDGSLDTLDCDGASTGFEGIFHNEPSSMDFDGMSNDVTITLPEGCGFTATVDGMSSHFTADQQVSLNNGSYVHGNGRCKIDMDGMSGNLTIHQGK